MPTSLLALVLALAPFTAEYRMSIAGRPVGDVRVELTARPGGFDLRYSSELYVRRGPTLTRDHSVATAALDSQLCVERLTSTRSEGGVPVGSVRGARAGGELRLDVTHGATRTAARSSRCLLPSSLAPQLLDASTTGCLPVVDETEGTVGEACAQAAESGQVRGTLLGEPFVAGFDEVGMSRLELTQLKAVYDRIDGPVPPLPAPPDLFGSGVALDPAPAGEARERTYRVHAPRGTELPTGASQSTSADERSLVVRWAPASPVVPVPLAARLEAPPAIAAAAKKAVGTARDRWSVARRLAIFVAQHVADDTPSPGERSAERVLAERRGSCVGHVQLFLALARAAGVPARAAVGLVEADHRLWGHAWAQVEVAGEWYDVDPTEGEAPAAAPRVLLAAGAQADDATAGALLARALDWKIGVVE